MLNEFHYKFDDEEEYDKMWHVYGAPKETIMRIEKQQGFLEKEKEKFIKQMDNNKSDFSTDIMKLDTDCIDIKKYKDIDQYEEVANMVKSIQARLGEASEYAKMINNRETLVELEDITDYQGIEQVKKDFKPYHDLWTIVEQWNFNYNSWLNDPIEEIDAAMVEDIVEGSNKTLA